jgi:hypothetical protein
MTEPRYAKKKESEAIHDAKSKLVKVMMCAAIAIGIVTIVAMFVR